MSGFTIEVTTTGASEVFTLPTVSGYSYNATVYWGDTTNSSITSWDDVDKAHTYASAGTYNIEIIGQFDAWSVNNISPTKTQITDIITWGDSGDFDGFAYLTSGFHGCSNINSFGTNKIIAKSGLVSLGALFYGCSIPSTIPSGFLDNCTNIQSIGYLFFLCNSLTSIPSDLLSSTAAALTNIGSAFRSCISLTSIPSGLFDGCINVTDASNIFNACTSITSIPDGLFDDMTSLTTLYRCFRSCSNLESIPDGLFRNNTACVNFSESFIVCGKLKMNPFVFYNNGEQSSRFLNKSIDFTNFYYLTGFTGDQGQAPDLYNCNFGTGTPVKTNCFFGNSLSSLVNYNNIPSDWGGTAYAGTPPVISSASSSKMIDGTTATIYGSGFESSGLSIYLSDNEDFSEATNVLQSDISHSSDTEASFVVDIGSFATGQTVYIYLVTSLSQTNDYGYGSQAWIELVDDLEQSQYVLSGATIGDIVDYVESVNAAVYSLSGNTIDDILDGIDDVIAASYSLSGNAIGDILDSIDALSASAYIITGNAIDDNDWQLSRIPLITESDACETIKNKIGEILALEFLSQQQQAVALGLDSTPYNILVYIERSNPFEHFLNGSEQSVINVWFDGDRIVERRSNSLTRQCYNGTFNIDCYASKKTITTGSSQTPGDMSSAEEANRIARIVRRILMHPTYIKLGTTDGSVWDRKITQRETFQPREQSIQKVYGVRLTLEVDYNEVVTLSEQPTIETLYITLQHEIDGLVRASLKMEV